MTRNNNKIYIYKKPPKDNAIYVKFNMFYEKGNLFASNVLRLEVKYARQKCKTKMQDENAGQKCMTKMYDKRVK